MSWKDRAIPVPKQADKASWKDRATLIEDQSEEDNSKETSLLSKVKSLGRGGLQGVTSGTADELAGINEALYTGTSLDDLSDTQKLLNTLMNPVATSATALTNLMKGAVTGEQFSEAYKKERDLSRELNKKAQEEDSGYYTGGEVMGGIAQALIPGTAVTKALPAAELIAQGALLGGGAGGLSGFGYSEADTSKELMGDAAKGALYGSTFGGGIPAVGRGVGKTGEWLGEKINRVEDAGTIISPLITATKDAFNEGTLYFGTKFREKLRDLQNKAVKETSTDLEKVGTKLKDVVELENKSKLGTIDKLKEIKADKKLEKQSVITQKKIEKIDTINSEIDQLQNREKEIKDAHNLLTQERQRLFEQNKLTGLANVDKERNKLAKVYQNLVQNTRDKLGKVYDNVDDVLNKKRFGVSLNDEAADTLKGLKFIDGTDDYKNIEKFLENFRGKMFEGEDYKYWKNQLDSLIDSYNSTPQIRSQLVDFRNSMRNKQINTLKKSGDPELEVLSDVILDTNKKYAALLPAYKKYAAKDPLTGSFKDVPLLNRQLSDFTEEVMTGVQDPNSLASDFIQTIKKSTPEIEEQIIPKVREIATKEADLLKSKFRAPEFNTELKQDLINRRKELSLLKTREATDKFGNIKAIDDDMAKKIATIDDEINSIEDQLSTIELTKLQPKNIAEKIALIPDELDRNKKIFSILKDYNKKVKLGEGSEATQQFIESYKQLTGKDLTKEAADLSKMTKFADTDIQGMLSPSGASLTALRTGQAVIGGTLGKAARVIAKPFKVTNDMLDKAVMKLGNNSPLAKTIGDIKNMPDGDAKTQKLFLLGQQPWYRNLIKEDVEKKNEE